MGERFGECRAILFADYKRKKPSWLSAGDVCCAAASFVARGQPVCWVHYQADTFGPRAGKVEFWKRSGKAK